jgi:hypothetical protein
MTTSNLIERKRIGSGNTLQPACLETLETNQDSRSTRTGSSTTLIPESPDSSDSQLTQSQEGNLETFQSFQDWLATFAPKGGEGDCKPDIEANLAALRLANPELQTEGRTSIPPDFSSLQTPPLKTETTSPETPGKLNLIVDLQGEGSSALKTEAISISADAQIYELIEVLYSQGKHH